MDPVSNIVTPTGRRVLLVDGGLAAALGAAGVVEGLSQPPGGNRAVYVAAAVCSVAPLAWRRRRPGPAAVAACLPLAAGPLCSTPTDDLLIVFVAAMLAVFSVALHGSRRSFTVAFGVILTLIAGSIVAGGGHEGAVLSDLLYAMVLLGGAALPARLLRRKLLDVAELTERAVRAERSIEDRARHAAMDERNRLARELHDIIGHGVSLMVVHAAAAETNLSDDAVARRCLAAVQDTGRQAVTDLARLLGVLRDEHTAIGLAPQPGIADLPRLATEARNSGDDLTLTVHGDGVPVAPALALTIYRIVQEGLTNARRHAPGAPVQVAVSIDDRSARVVVRNEPGRAPVAPHGHSSTGTGLVGLGERAELFGGSLCAGPTPDGGFALSVELPQHGTLG